MTSKISTSTRKVLRASHPFRPRAAGSALAIVAASFCAAAQAQQTLPMIDVGAARPRAAAAPVRASAAPSRVVATPAPAHHRAPTPVRVHTPAPAPIVPASVAPPLVAQGPIAQAPREPEKPFSKTLPDNIPAVVHTVTAKQIQEQVNASNAVETLRYLPSIEVIEKFPGDRFQDIQGRTTGPFQPMHNLVYADGILLSALLGGSGFTPRFQMVTPSEIARVDVISGPYSALYSGNAIGGVVTFTTRTPEKFELHAKTQGLLAPYDQFDTHQTNTGYTGSLSIGNRHDSFSWLATYDRLLTHAQPIFFSFTSRSGVAGLPVAGGIFDTDRRGVFPRAVLGAGPIQTTEQNTGKLKLAYDFGQRARASYTIGLLHLKDNYHPQSYVRNAAGFPIYNTPNGIVDVSGLNFTGPGLNPGNVEYMHLMQGAEFKTDTGGVFDLDLVASSYDMLRDVGVDALRFGINTLGRTREISGTGWKTADMRAIWRPEQDVLGRHEISFGGHFDQYVLKQYQDDTPTYWSSYSTRQFNRSVGKTRTVALYLQDVWSLAPDWKLTLGGRQEFWRAFEGANENRIGTTKDLDERSAAAFSPKAALTFRATPELLLRGSYGAARRFPGVTELFQRTIGQGGVLVNNPDLKPEQTDSYDLTAEYVFGKHAAHLSLFHEDRWNAIVFQQNTTVVPIVSSNQNVEKLRFNGVEGAVGLKDVLFDGFDVDANATYIDTQIVANSRFPVSVNKDVPLLPRWRAKIVGTYHPTKDLTLSAALRYKGTSYFELDNSDINHQTWGGAGRAIILDARATYKFAENWTAVAGVNNLTRYKQWLFSPYPQRTFFAELRYDY